MLTNLHVKNLALIKEAEVEFTKGLNILTGETGAGKSIIIGSINYALGTKTDSDVIREGEENAFIELVFQVDKEKQKKQIEAMDLPMEDGTVIITKKITKNRSVLKVCGETVTARQMKELAGVLIDIHGQHEHQSLLLPKKQKEILDGFAGEKLLEKKEALATEYKEYQQMVKERDDLSVDDAGRERSISLARYEYDEIEQAGLTPGEEKEVERQYRRMQNGQKIAENVGRSISYLKGEDGSALDQVGQALYELQQVAEYDDGLSEIKDHLADAESILSDAYHEIVNFMEESSFDQESFDEITARLDLLNHLMSKYGRTTEEVIAYGERKRQELEKLENLSEYLQELSGKIEKKEKKIWSLCREIHEIRKKISVELSRDITSVLEDMNFLKVAFEIGVDEKENFGPDGADEIVFRISLNPGERMKPIADVASGGELSRIMLALKTVFAQKDDIDTLIFDEIDTGISGKTAWKVSEVMGKLSRSHQVLCITHLPQIAAMADTHFMIEKTEQEGKTTTDIYELSEEKSDYEVARLLGTDTISDAVLENARELRFKAAEVKKS